MRSLDQVKLFSGKKNKGLANGDSRIKLMRPSGGQRNVFLGRIFNSICHIFILTANFTSSGQGMAFLVIKHL